MSRMTICRTLVLLLVAGAITGDIAHAAGITVHDARTASIDAIGNDAVTTVNGVSVGSCWASSCGV